MHIHILGICGTFMGGLALLGRELGLEVSGSDANVYPPMSSQLRAAGIRLQEGYGPEFLAARPDLVLVGNALSRGNPAVEALLDSGVDYRSGPQWLAESVLHRRRVLAVAGTHGKTTTSALLAWILESAGLSPGFLIGGVPLDFPGSARLGEGECFVIEADEYDTAFFDKRSKFVHYRPRTLVLTNLEYDHADIFPDLAAIQRQFQHLLRTVPAGGLVVVNAGDTGLREVLEAGCWSARETFATGDAPHADWAAAIPVSGEGRICITAPGGAALEVEFGLPGTHNLANAVAAVAAARHVGVAPAAAVGSLAGFHGVKRRLEVLVRHAGVTLYDDFAHHPTAIGATLAALRQRVGQARLVAVVEPASNTMRRGVHAARLSEALSIADRVYLWQRPDLAFDPRSALRPLGDRARVEDSVDSIAKSLLCELHNGDHVVLLSNGAFGGLHDQLVAGINRR